MVRCDEIKRLNEFPQKQFLNSVQRIRRSTLRFFVYRSPPVTRNNDMEISSCIVIHLNVHYEYRWSSSKTINNNKKTRIIITVFNVNNPNTTRAGWLLINYPAARRRRRRSRFRHRRVVRRLYTLVAYRGGDHLTINIVLSAYTQSQVRIRSFVIALV